MYRAHSTSTIRVRVCVLTALCVLSTRTATACSACRNPNSDVTMGQMGHRTRHQNWMGEAQLYIVSWRRIFDRSGTD